MGIPAISRGTIDGARPDGERDVGAGVRELHRDFAGRIARADDQDALANDVVGPAVLDAVKHTAAEAMASRDLRRVRVRHDARGDDDGAGLDLGAGRSCGRSRRHRRGGNRRPRRVSRPEPGTSPRTDGDTRESPGASESAALTRESPGRAARRAGSPCAARGCRRGSPTSRRSVRHARARRAARPARDSSRDVARPAGPAPTTSASHDAMHHREPAYNVFRYSISARRFASVRIRDQKSWPALPDPGRSLLNQFRSSPKRRSSSASPSRASARIGIERLADPRAVERSRRHHLEDLRAAPTPGPAGDAASAHSRCGGTGSWPTRRSAASPHTRGSSSAPLPVASGLRLNASMNSSDTTSRRDRSVPTSACTPGQPTLPRPSYTP